MVKCSIHRQYAKKISRFIHEDITKVSQKNQAKVRKLKRHQQGLSWVTLFSFDQRRFVFFNIIDIARIKGQGNMKIFRR